MEAELPARGSDAGVAGTRWIRFGIFSAWLSRDLAWIIGGALLFAVGPFTLLMIFPTNKKLQSAELDVTSSEAERLLRLWGQLHAVRSVLSLLAFAVFLYVLKSGRG